MNSIKELLVENLVDVSLHKIGQLSIRIAESSVNKCCSCFGMYETKFPKELLSLDEE
jgi:cyclic lactone autoinducer peptide